MKISMFGLAALMAATLAAPALALPAEPILLYAGAAPGSEHATQVEVSSTTKGGRIVRNITQPKLLVYPPAPGTANGVGVIVAPGGGYHILSIDNEGTKVAERLAARGLTVFVLKYRLNETPQTDAGAMIKMFTYLAAIHGMPDGLPPVTPGETLAVADAFQAVRLVRGHAAEWGLDPHKIGFVGFSAGAMLATDVGTGYDAQTRPDFLGAMYGGLRTGHVPPADAPPIFIAAAVDDSLLPGRSTPIYDAWRAAHRPVELHLYEHGGHGFGMEHLGTASDHWIEQFIWWLEAHGYAAPEKRP